MREYINQILQEIYEDEKNPYKYKRNNEPDNLMVLNYDGGDGERNDGD